MTPEAQKLKTLLEKQNKKQFFNESKVPEYVVHNYHEIRGFFGKYRFLSNFYECPNGIWYEGMKFPSTEHAYQAAKVEKENRYAFQSCNVKEVKRLGGLVFINKEEWEKVKYNVMLQLVTQKFATHDDLREKLLETRKAFLEETNHWHDRTWGVCNGIGKNWLGIILMGVREIFSMDQ